MFADLFIPFRRSSVHHHAALMQFSPSFTLLHSLFTATRLYVLFSYTIHVFYARWKSSIFSSSPKSTATGPMSTQAGVPTVSENHFWHHVIFQCYAYFVNNETRETCDAFIILPPWRPKGNRDGLLDILNSHHTTGLNIYSIWVCDLGETIIFCN